MNTPMREIRLHDSNYPESYILGNNVLCYVVNKKLKVFNSELDLLVECAFNRQIKNIFFVDDFYILILDELNIPSIFTFNKATNVLNVIDLRLSENEIFTSLQSFESLKRIIIKSEKDILDVKTGIYDFELKDTTYPSASFFATEIINDNLFGISEGQITLFSNTNFEISWQYNLTKLPSYLDTFHNEKPADVQQILGIYNEMLWVHVGGDRLIGLDIDTGKLLHNFENVLLGEEGNAFMDTKNGIIKSLWLHQYIEFDLKTFKTIKTVTDIGESKQISIRRSNFYLDDTNLYFCGYHNKADFPNCFGVLDTSNCEITFLEISKDTHYFNPPQANRELLAILDDDKTLSVYKREKMLS